MDGMMEPAGRTKGWCMTVGKAQRGVMMGVCGMMNKRKRE